MFAYIGWLATGDGVQLGKMMRLADSHSALTHLIFVAALINVAFALSVSKNPIPLAKMMQWGHRIVLFGGRANLLLSFVWFGLDPYFHGKSVLMYWWMLASVLCWVGIEVAAKRLVQSDLNVVLVGGMPSKFLFLGFAIELALILVFYAIMSSKAWH